MKRFKALILLSILMLFLLPFSPHMAVHYPLSPITHHPSPFIYMFAHANVFHLLINTWSLLVLHRYATRTSLIMAYICAVLIAFIPPISLFSYLAPTYLAPRQGLLGFSVIVCFLLGTVPRRSVGRLFMAMLPFLLGFLVPGMAALHHILMLLAGFLYAHVLSLVRSYRSLFP